MPDKDPTTWTTLWDLLTEPMRAAIVAAAVALIRVMYDGREPSKLRRLLECALCGAIALSVASLAEAMGIEGDYSTFAGGAIGLLGADTVRAWAVRVGERRIKDIES